MKRGVEVEKTTAVMLAAATCAMAVATCMGTSLVAVRSGSGRVGVCVWE